MGLKSAAVPVFWVGLPSVRGTRVQKLRCDEVELFTPEVWDAVQLTTQSKLCGGVEVRALRPGDQQGIAQASAGATGILSRSTTIADATSRFAGMGVTLLFSRCSTAFGRLWGSRPRRGRR